MISVVLTELFYPLVLLPSEGFFLILSTQTMQHALRYLVYIRVGSLYK